MAEGGRTARANRKRAETLAVLAKLKRCSCDDLDAQPNLIHDGGIYVQGQIRVGIVGANAKKSWASLSHVPAIKGLTGLKLAAVATRNEQSAREAAEAFGADRWFSDPSR